jgi:hypothetical protein
MRWSAGGVDVVVAQAVARLVWVRVPKVAHSGAAEPGAGEDAVPKPIVDRGDPGHAVTAWAVDGDLEAEGRDIAERAEGQGGQHEPEGRAAVTAARRPCAHSA